jgi:hypothetical protein
VVALREVDGMPHGTPGTPTRPQQLWWLAIPEICPPGEGILVGAGSIKEPSTALQRCGLSRGVSRGSVPMHGQ